MEKIEPIRFETGRAMLLAGLRRYHTYADSGREIPRQWQQLRSLGELPGRVDSKFYGATCGPDQNGFEYMCGVEVSTFALLATDVGRMHIFPQRYAVFWHGGQVSGIQATWKYILHEWLPNSGFESAHKPDLEIYDSRFDANTGLGGVEIWISISGDELNSHLVSRAFDR